MWHLSIWDGISVSTLDWICQSKFITITYYNFNEWEAWSNFDECKTLQPKAMDKSNCALEV